MVKTGTGSEKSLAVRGHFSGRIMNVSNSRMSKTRFRQTSGTERYASKFTTIGETWRPLSVKSKRKLSLSNRNENICALVDYVKRKQRDYSCTKLPCGRRNSYRAIRGCTPKSSVKSRTGKLSDFTCTKLLCGRRKSYRVIRGCTPRASAKSRTVAIRVVPREHII